MNGEDRVFVEFEYWILTIVAVFPPPGTADDVADVPFPVPVAHFKTWKIDVPEVLSTNAIFVPSDDNDGEVMTRPPVCVVTL
jgi:hypothetical protein